jgi:hypothetical protein
LSAVAAAQADASADASADLVDPAAAIDSAVSVFAAFAIVDICTTDASADVLAVLTSASTNCTRILLMMTMPVLMLVLILLILPL